MSREFMPLKSLSLAEERRIKAIARSLVVTKESTEKIEKLYEQYRDICEQIRELTGEVRFRGTYTEVLDLYKRTVGAVTPELDKLIGMWRVLDSAIKVEADKLGYTGDRWLRNCWREEIDRDAALSRLH